MAVRHLYIARHGAADAFGDLTDVGHRQSRLLGQRLASVPIDVVWHSPLPRAAASARTAADHLSGAPVIESTELVDHIPYVPTPQETPEAWRGFFDGYDDTEVTSSREHSSALTAAFAQVADAARTTHELLITHAYPIAWLVREALDAPPHRWLGLESANTALTVIEHHTSIPAALIMFNDMTHLPDDLRWTGFTGDTRP